MSQREQRQWQIHRRKKSIKVENLGWQKPDNYHGKGCNLRLIFISPKWMYVLRTEFQRWEENCSDTAACGEEQSLFLISISASHCPTLLLCLQTSHRKISDQNIALLKNSLLSSYSASFPSVLLHQSFWFSVRKCKASASNDTQFWKFVIFNCNLKESRNVYVFKWITKERFFSGIIICNIALDWRVKEEKSLFLK